MKKADRRLPALATPSANVTTRRQRGSLVRPSAAGPGDEVTAAAKVTPASRGRPIVLQVKWGGSWHPLDGAPASGLVFSFQNLMMRPFGSSSATNIIRSRPPAMCAGVRVKGVQPT